MTDDAAPTTLDQALCSVMADLPAIAKKKHPSEGGKGLTYAYRGIEEITSEVQGLFAKYGVVVVPNVQKREVVDIEVNGNPWTDTFLEVRWSIRGHGQCFEACTFGQGRDNSDKGTNKAMTQAFKYLLLDMLCISDPADDNDGTNVEADARSGSAAGSTPTSRSRSSSQNKDSKVGLIIKIAKDMSMSSDDLAAFVDKTLGRNTSGFDDLSAVEQTVIVEALRAKEREGD